MKTRVNLSIENEVLLKAKKTKSQSLINYIDKLEVPKIDSEIDFKKGYHQNKSEEYVSYDISM